MRDFLEVFLRDQVDKLKKRIVIAHVDTSANELIKNSALVATATSLTITFLVFLLVDKVRGRSDVIGNVVITLITFILSFLFSFLFSLNSINAAILRRKKEMDQEVLFAGRYLLIKMQSGTPFFNSLIDASKVFGIAGKFFKEVIDEVNTGKPIEDALNHAAETCPSKRFSIILREMNNALKLGVDISKTLELILDDIAYEQLEEIKGFGQKINALSMFYMILAVVMPSLGIAIFIIAASFVGIQIGLIHLMFASFLLMFMQFMFLALFKTIRPVVNL